MSQSKPTLFINQLTFTRFIAAILVFSHHFARGFYPFESYYIKNFILVSNTAVPYFFLLSGFILTYVYYTKKEKSFKQFWVARFSRIYPLYIFALLLDIGLKLHFWDNFELNSKDLILNIFIIQSWFGERQLSCNGPGWSLSVKFFFYLSYPFILYFFLQKQKLKTIMISCCTLWLVTQIIHIAFIEKVSSNPYWYSILQFNPLTHLGTFLLGCSAGVLYIEKQNTFQKTQPWALSAAAISLALFSFLMIIPNPIIKYHHSGLFTPLLIIFIISLSIHKGKTTTLLSSKPLIYLGEISFGLYILQYPALYITRYLHDKISLPQWESLNMYYHLILLLIISIISYHIIEIPSKKILRKITSKKNVTV